MAFERAIHEAMTPFLELVYSRFPPWRRIRAGFYGAGALGAQAVERFRPLADWEFRFYDRSPEKQGGTHAGVSVASPGELETDPPDCLVITPASGQEALVAQFQALGFVRRKNLFLLGDEREEGPRSFRFHPYLCGKVREAAARHLKDTPCPDFPA
jgi:hypothetical protein